MEATKVLLDKKRITDLENVTHLACTPENACYNAEAYGKAQGLALALGIINGSGPTPVPNRPRKWGADQKFKLSKPKRS